MHSACRWCRSCGETEDEGSDIVVGAGGGRDDFFGGGRGELWGKRVRVGRVDGWRLGWALLLWGVAEAAAGDWNATAGETPGAGSRALIAGLVRPGVSINY